MLDEFSKRKKNSVGEMEERVWAEPSPIKGVTGGKAPV